MDHVKIIIDKCERFWNAPKIGVEEMHAILSFIHIHANDVQEQLNELEKEKKDLQFRLDAIRAIIHAQDGLKAVTVSEKSEKEDDGND